MQPLFLLQSTVINILITRHVTENGEQNCSWHKTDLLPLPLCYCSLFISCWWLAGPLWRVFPNKSRLVLSVQLNTIVMTLSCCLSLTKDTHDRASFVFIRAVTVIQARDKCSGTDGEYCMYRHAHQHVKSTQTDPHTELLKALVHVLCVSSMAWGHVHTKF